MSTTTIVTLIISILTGLASLATCCACYFTYKTTRPNVKIKIDKRLCIWVNDKMKQFAIVYFFIRNLSMITGTFDTIYISYKKKRFPAQSIDMNYDIQPIQLSMDMEPGNIPVDVSKKHLILPLKVEGLSFADGFFIFPNFVADSGRPIKVSMFVRYPNKYFKRCIARKICLTEKANVIKNNENQK